MSAENGHATGGKTRREKAAECGASATDGRDPGRPDVPETEPPQFVVAAELLPEMVRVAKLVHHTQPEIRTAVLLGWTGLAGLVGWTPEMVAMVEEAIR